MSNFDSTIDTREHIQNIRRVFLEKFLPELLQRFAVHDQSKLEEPERSCYDEFIPKIRVAEYGSDEYEEIRSQMQRDGLDHHYQVNRHHPEHFPNGVNGMNLIDFVEYVLDCYAASMRSKTPFEKTMKTNMDKYDIPEMLQNIVFNTVHDLDL